MKILVTGFEPFNGQTVNPSEQIVSCLIAPKGVKLIKEILPVEFKKATIRLKELVRLYQPDVVLSIGQAGGRPEISIERVAINVDCVKSSNGKNILADNAGEVPVDEPIELEGAPAYFSNLSLWRMVEAIQEKGIPAGISNTAGTYVCNHIMYIALHMGATEYSQMKAGFIHVPFLPEQIADREDKERLSVMTLEDMVLALQTALEVITCDDKKKLIARVEQMEQLMEDVATVLENCPESIKMDEVVKRKIAVLEDYQRSGQWLSDFECDERGELPLELKRGILSEDLLYNLLCDTKEWL